jgi:asparagine synthase (glutamine-hydrolysing)
MCGIAGLWNEKGTSSEHLLGIARSMTDAISYRGPDDSGVWLEATRGVVLGHRRLSIVDLSAEGRQPMVSRSERYVISFNGEVFNHVDLKRQIEEAIGRKLELRGHSDTEIMLAAIEEWGLRGAVERFVGMFAFALWDRRERALSLVRDRLGIKPLYYGVADGTLLFGSELKSLVAHPAFSREIDRAALCSYFRFGYVSAPRSIYVSARKLPPGCIIEFSAPRLDAAKNTRYWSPIEVAEKGLSRPFLGNERDAEDELVRLLDAAVRLRLVADVPIGAFLSGGIDSSTVVAFMQQASTTPVRTFSIANEDAAFDESHAAAAVARHLGTAHTALTVTAEEARAVVPLLPRMYDEPFADSSQIPTFLVSRLAREQVTVALSGDGGDELFGGYNRHVWGAAVWPVLAKVPRPLRTAVGSLLLGAPPASWDRLFELGDGLLPDLRNPGAKVHKLAGVLDASSPDDLYRRLTSLWTAPERIVIGEAPPPESLPDLRDAAATMMVRDLATYLPDDILTKVDRASMAVSLEARVPLLDHRVVEFAWTLPRPLKVKARTGKRILRRVLSRYVPPALFERPKTGFSVPVGAWLRGPLRGWAGEQLERRSLERSGLLVPAAIERAWAEHLSGSRDNSPALWTALMFQAWHSAWIA